MTTDDQIKTEPNDALIESQESEPEVVEAAAPDQEIDPVAALTADLQRLQAELSLIHI